MTTTEQRSRAITLHRRHVEVLAVRGVLAVAAVFAVSITVLSLITALARQWPKS
jgi:hypothetical protein